MIGEAKRRILFKVISMNAKWLFLFALVLLMGCQQAGIGADNLGVRGDEEIAPSELDRQLKINRDALLKGSSEQIRMDAASVMLFSEDPQAREVLLDALRLAGNRAARVAVCEALIRTRGVSEALKQKSDFIQPLVEILSTEDSATAKLAAEATLIFEYEQISKLLEDLARDPLLPTRARLNAISAVKLQPDMRAIFTLMGLLDEPEKQVAVAAEEALHSLGIPVGKDAKTRKQIVEGLKRKGRDEFLRDWLIRQEAQMRKLESESAFWQGRYLSALGKIYDGISDDTAKGEFLAGHLGDAKAGVRLWALEKVSQWRVGTKSKLPVELGPILIGLVSAQDRDVRLKTARLLSLMAELNSAGRLLEQLENEEDDEVRMELFIALGGACHYAFLPDSGIEIAPEIRKETLEWAEKYLFERDTERAANGAKVTKRLLEQDGFTSSEVDRYFGLLFKRYVEEQDTIDGSLRGELLVAMAGLCAQSVYKTEAGKIFKPLFEGALHDETDLVREAAVDGLIYIDRGRALRMLRGDSVNDGSVIVRRKLIELAGEVGSREDLFWLAEKVGPSAESGPAWQAMLKIFKRLDAGVVNEWIANYELQDSQDNQGGLSDEQMISLLEITERKAGENDTGELKDIRDKLARLHTKAGDFERGAVYLGMLWEAAQSPEEKDAVLGRLLDVYLRWPNVNAAAQLASNCLLEKDLGSDHVIVVSIDNYLNQPIVGADPNAMIAALFEIKTAGPRPMWTGHVKRWGRLVGQPMEVEENPEKPGN